MTRLPLILLAIAAFLLPIWGGYLSVDPQPLEPGMGSLLSSLHQGPEAAMFAHALISLLMAAAFVMALFQRSVVQFPWPRIAIAAMLLIATLLLSILVSQHRFLSLATFVEWCFYPLATFAVVGLAGRKGGPILLISALAVGCFVVAVLGLYEYRNQPDPSWRIFGTWLNPNALAGMLLVGYILSLGLALTQKGITAILPVIASAIIGVGIVLTQSKGGYLAVLIGVFILALLVLIWTQGGKKKLAGLGTIAASLVLVAVLSQAIVAAAAAPPATGGRASSRAENGNVLIGGRASSRAENADQPAMMLISAPVPVAPNQALSRVTQAGASAEQSSAFRILLWKSALGLVKMQPSGVGVGAFKYHSARPGLTTITQLAHNSYLQLAAEATIVAPLFLLAFGFMALFEMFRGSKALPQETNLLRGSVIAAIVAAAVHNAVDSDLYHYGTGVALFMLVGIGLQLSSDAAVPEFLPKSGRGLIAGGLALLLGFFFYFAWVEILHSNAEFAAASRKPDKYKETVSQLQSMAGTDPRTWSQAARLDADPVARAADLGRAIDFGPQPRFYRDRAQAFSQADNPAGADSALTQGLYWDPNNLQILSDLAALQAAQGEEQKSLETLRRLVATEGTQYFTIRSLPELVPLETYRARVILAKAETDPRKQADLLQPAVAGFRSYADNTIPRVKVMAAQNMRYGGEDPDSALQAMNEAVEAATSLAQALATKGDEANRKLAEADIGRFRNEADTLAQLYVK